MTGKLKPKPSIQIEDSLVEKYCNPKPLTKPNQEVLKSLAREQRSIDRVKKLKAEEKRLLEKVSNLNELAKQQIDNFKEIASISDYALASVNFRENNSDVALASLVYLAALAKHFAKYSEEALSQW